MVKAKTQVTGEKIERIFGKTVSLRLDTQEWEKLNAMAVALGLPPAVLARVPIRPVLSWLSVEEVQDFLLSGTLVKIQPTSMPKSPVLSPRERDTLYGLWRGYSNREIADALQMSEQTVKNYVSAIFRKLEAGNRVQAVTRALEMNLVGNRKGGDVY